MTIKFLADYSVGVPIESFTAGQILHDRGAASELHFVRRRVAAYMDAEGNLTDMDGKPVVEGAPTPAQTQDTALQLDRATPDSGTVLQASDLAPKAAPKTPAAPAKAKAANKPAAKKGPAKKAGAKKPASGKKA